MKFKRILSLTVVAITVTFLLFSCNFGKYPGFKKTDAGLYYKIYNPENSDTAIIRTGSIVSMSLDYGLKDSMIFESKTMPEPLVMSVNESAYPGDFFDALTLCREGDSATFILKAGPFFKQTVGQPSVPSFCTEETDLYFTVKINKVQTREQAEAERLEKNEILRNQEMENLEHYLTEHKITATPTADGVYYLETKKGLGKTPGQDSYASVQYTVYLLGNPNKLFSTYDKNEPLEFKLGGQFENPGFQEAVKLMKEGGKANAIVPSAMAFGERGAGSVVPPFSTLYYDIELVKVMSKEEFDKKQDDAKAKKEAENVAKQKSEEANIQKYMKDNNLTPTTVLPNGLIYIEKQAGTGASPTEGQKVKVHYTGRLLDGTVFDSSIDRGEPLEFTIGRRAVIEGWDTGIPLMKEGGKAMLIIPSKIGYKDRSMGDKIKPYSTLVFDVELVEVEKDSPAK